MTQKLKIGKIFNMIFIRFSSVRIFHENGSKIEEEGGLHILTWNEAKDSIGTRHLLKTIFLFLYTVPHENNDSWDLEKLSWCSTTIEKNMFLF